MESHEQEQLEKKLMEMLLTNPHPVAKILMNQYQHSKITSTEYSGAGFFTNFKVKYNVEKAPKNNFEITGIVADIGEQKDALGFVLFIRDGYIKMLEGYTLLIDFWPDNYKDVVLKFIDPKGITAYNEKFSDIKS